MSRSLRFALVAMLLSSMAHAVLPDENPASEERLFLVEFTTGPGWLPDTPFREQPHAADHSANLRRLREDGRILLGGRHGLTGMIILRVGREAEARAEIERDPSIQAGVFVYEIAEFRPFYEGCVGTPSPTEAGRAADPPPVGNEN